MYKLIDIYIYILVIKLSHGILKKNDNRVALPAVNSLFSVGDTSISSNFKKMSKMVVMGNQICLWIHRRIFFPTALSKNCCLTGLFKPLYLFLLKWRKHFYGKFHSQ